MRPTQLHENHVRNHIHQVFKGCARAQQSYHVTNSWRKKAQGRDGGRYIVKTRGAPLRIKYQSPLPGAHLRVDSGKERFANGAKQICGLTSGLVIRD